MAWIVWTIGFVGLVGNTVWHGSNWWIGTEAFFEAIFALICGIGFGIGIGRMKWQGSR